MAAVCVRPLRASDVRQIQSLHVRLPLPKATSAHPAQAQILPVHYSHAFFTQLLVLPSRACLVAARLDHPHSPVAFISAALHKSPGLPRIELLTLGVLPAFQNRGLARRLISAVIDKLHGPLAAGILVHANVAATNSVALKFYKNIGLRISSEVIPNLYRTCPPGQRDAYLVTGRIDTISI